MLKDPRALHKQYTYRTTDIKVSCSLGALKISLLAHIKQPSFWFLKSILNTRELKC